MNTIPTRKLLLALSLLGASQLSAQSWSSGTGGNWDLDTNWSPTIVPNAVDAVASIQGFTAAGVYDIAASTPATFTVGTLNLGTQTASVDDVDLALRGTAANIQGIIFDVSSGTAALNFFTVNNSGSTLAISAPLQLNDNLTVSVTRQGSTQISPVFNGAINLQGNTMTFDGARTAGTVINSVITGTGKLAFTGTGSDRSTVFAASTSTFSGGIDLNGNGNVITLGNGTTFTSSSTEGILGTGPINFLSTNNSAGNPRSPTLSCSGAFFSPDSDAITNRLANPITVGAGRFGVIDTLRPINTYGLLTGTGKLYKQGGANNGQRQWAINNANPDFAGTIEIQNGQIQARVTDAIGANATLVFNPTSGVNGVGLIGGMAVGANVTLGSALQFARSASGFPQFITTSGNSTLTLAGNFSETGTGTSGYIGLGRGNQNLTSTGGGFAAGTNTGVATIALTGTGSLSNPIGIVNGTSTASVLSLGNIAGVQTFSGPLSGTGSLVRNGIDGVSILSGANSYTGATTVTAGTLLVNGTHVGGGNYSITGVLGGAGTITPAAAASFTVNTGGAIAPGADAGLIGTLILDGVNSTGVLATLASGAKLNVDLDATLGMSDWLALANGAAGDLVFNNNVVDIASVTGTLADNQAFTLVRATAADNYSGLTFDGANRITAGLSIGTGLAGFGGSYLSLIGSDIVLTLVADAPAGNALTAFRAANSLASDGSQDLATPAGDGVSNLLKYAFNMIGAGAGQAADLSIANSSVLAPDGFAGLPLVGVEAGTGKLTVTYIRRKASGTPAPAVTYAVQFNSDLAASGGWAENLAATESVTSLDATSERVVVTDSISATPRRFARVQVTEIAP